MLDQWKEELEQKTNEIFSVHIHHGKDKLKTLERIRSKDVIVVILPRQLLLLIFLSAGHHNHIPDADKRFHCATVCRARGYLPMGYRERVRSFVCDIVSLAKSMR